jgi:hypothetical protein
MTNVKAGQIGHTDSGFQNITFANTTKSDRFKKATDVELLAILAGGTTTNNPARLLLCARCTHKEDVLPDVAVPLALNEGKTPPRRSEPKAQKPISPCQERR